jgi:two-component system phosphate regulon sensor histidine kinase PhoR
VVSLGSTVALPHLREAVGSLAEQAERAGVSLAVEGDEGVELPLRPRMMRVVARNLAENAIRYAGEGAAFRLSAFGSADGVVLEASDDGVGVSAEDASRLFERFYRADRARSSRGTGLGLAIVKHVVTSAGGSVQATGGVGRGLTIRCVFPP